MSDSFFSGPRRGLVTVFLAALAIVFSTTPAWAGPGYELDSTSPSISLGAEIPIGVAVDQSSQAIYVAELSRSLLNIQPGQVEQLTPSGTPTASSPFGTGGQDFFISVAVNPVTHGVYAFQQESPTPSGTRGVTKISTFSSAGVLGTSFAPVKALAMTIAADASGRLFYPNDAAGSVQIFSSSGALEGSVTCAGCPGGSFAKPQAVAFDSAGKLYVVDVANGGRVVKLSLSGGSYAYESTLPGAAGAVAVAVDSSSGDIFVGRLTSGEYHVVAYNSAGVAFDDFGAGLVTKALIEGFTGQLAVNATTHDVYLTSPGGRRLWVLERVASIPAPTAGSMAPNPVGQIEATLRATVNPKEHVLTSCGFEYTDHADFLANGYANATTAPCPAVVGNEESTIISAKVKDLDPATSYDYRVKIANFGGSAEVPSQSFQTLPPLPPEATTGTASALTKTTATLAGTVNPKGGTVSNCHFEYIAEAGFQSGGFTGATSKACATTPSGNVNVNVSAKVTGLTVGTTYRARVVATNNSGTTQAADKTFATVAETCAENPQLCPPETPPTPAPPAQVEAGPLPASPAPPQAKPLKCRKGFKKKLVRGKPKCVRVKKRTRKR